MSQWALQAHITTPADLNLHGDKEKHWEEKKKWNKPQKGNSKKNPPNQEGQECIGAERSS